VQYTDKATYSEWLKEGLKQYNASMSKIAIK